MTKIISFSLWGVDPKYTVGTLKNVLLAKELYPDWICRVYVDFLVPVGIVFRLREFDNVEIVEMPTVGDYLGMYWRFHPVSELDVDVVLVRDADSRLSLREKACVDDWLASDKGIMSIADHPYHIPYAIMPGLSGFKNGSFSQMKERIDGFDKTNEYGTDYRFFQSIIGEMNDELVTYSDFKKGSISIPHERNGLEFCGEVYDQNDDTVKEHTEALRKVLSQ